MLILLSLSLIPTVKIKSNPIVVENRITGGILPSLNVTQLTLREAEVVLDIDASHFRNKFVISFNGTLFANSKIVYSISPPIATSILLEKTPPG